MNIYFRRILVLGMLFCVAGLVQAKTIYINDQLRVGLRPLPDNDSAPLTVAVTGDKLEFLESDSGYVKVRTEEGVEGWIKEIYTTTSVPAIVQLKTLSQSAGGTNQKIKELARQIDIIQSANQNLSNELEQAKSEKSKIQMKLLTLQSSQTASPTWMYWLVGLFVFTAISFVGGVYWYRHQAMKRLGGLRIYF